MRKSVKNDNIYDSTSYFNRLYQDVKDIGNYFKNKIEILKGRFFTIHNMSLKLQCKQLLGGLVTIPLKCLRRKMCNAKSSTSADYIKYNFQI